MRSTSLHRVRSVDPGVVYWIGRGFGFLVAVAIFSGALGSGIGSRHETFAFVQLGIIGALCLFLAVGDLRERSSLGGPAQLAALVGVAAAGALSAQLGVQSLTMAYTVGACYEGGHRLSAEDSLLVTVVGLAAVAVSGALFGFKVGATIGWPLLIATCTALGHLRRQARERAERLAALMEEMRRRQADDLRAAALEERHRIAREIHDVLAHSLSALGIQIEAARAVLGDGGDREIALGLLDAAQSLADRGLGESREAIHALRADRPPLPEALRALVDARAPDRAALTVSGEPRSLSPAASLALVRIAHEALANAERHAPGAAVQLRLAYGDDVTELSVVNQTATATATSQAEPDGGPARPGRSGGYGIVGMRERIALLGGELSAGPADGGWSVSARVPR